MKQKRIYEFSYYWRGNHSMVSCSTIRELKMYIRTALDNNIPFSVDYKFK